MTKKMDSRGLRHFCTRSYSDENIIVFRPEERIPVDGGDDGGLGVTAL
jgi:hypothetical protein